MRLELISRNHAFELCPQLAQQLMGWQRAMFDPYGDISLAGDKVYLESDDEKPTTLTQQQADQLNREHSEYCYSMCDDFEKLPAKSDFYERIIVKLEATSFDTFAEVIGQKITQLSLELGWENIILISNSRSAYLEQENPHEPVKEATRKLMAMGMSKTTTEALRLDESTIADFFTSIFWIVRCNMSASGISFSSKKSSIIGELSKYGNLDFSCYNKTEAKLLRQALKSLSFIELTDRTYTENFSEGSAIEGRQLNLN